MTEYSLVTKALESKVWQCVFLKISVSVHDRVCHSFRWELLFSSPSWRPSVSLTLWERCPTSNDCFPSTPAIWPAGCASTKMDNVTPDLSVEDRTQVSLITAREQENAIERREDVARLILIHRTSSFSSITIKSSVSWRPWWRSFILQWELINHFNDST